MNEQLQQALAVLIEKSINGIDASVNFMQAEIPEVIEQLLMWYVVKGIVFLVLAIFIFIAFVVASKRIWNYSQDSKGYFDGEMASFLIFILSIPVFFLEVICLNIEWLQIWIAPKVWLIEYASKIAS